jgi:type IV secretory pathway VirB6-like protein
MPLSSKLHKLLRSLLCCVLLLLAVFIPSKANAIYEGVRSDTVYRSNRMCNGNDLKFNPFGENKDLYWDSTNPACYGFMIGVGAALVATGRMIDGVGYGAIKVPGTCTPQNDYGKPKEEGEKMAARFSPTSPQLVATSQLALYRYSGLCGSRAAELATASAANVISCTPPATSNCPYTTTQTSLATADTIKCCSSYSTYLGIFTSAVATLTVMWDKARNTYENARLCGHDWNQWVEEDGTHIKKAGPYQICLKQAFAGNNTIDASCADTLGVRSNELQDVGRLHISNKFYREFIYGGKEFPNHGNNSCDNPWASNKDLRRQYLGYEDDEQKYYMTGSGGSASVFACHRFLAGGMNDDTQKAYDCCRRRSQTSVCIQNKTGLGLTLGEYKTRFCEIGSFCDVADTKFEVYNSVENPSYACVKTYSLCPYNHLLGGGTEKQEIDPNISKGARVVNYCQYLNHCTKLPILPYVYSSNLGGAHISSACRDLKGDAQNKYGYTDQLVPINTRNFSAPMAQCFKETMENMFLNKAGATKCEDPKEKPDSNGICAKGYIYKKGDALVGNSFFVKIQGSLKTAIKMGLVVSIIVFGYAILMGVPKVDSFSKKALLSYIVKISIVMYFAIGTGWQSGFMNGVLGFSGFMSEMAFRPDSAVDPSRLDGCQFPRFNYADSNESTKYNNPAYPKGMEYLRIWDTLDCKLARALGYGPEVSVPNLIFMILGGFLDYGAGLVFVVASFFLAFVMIMITARALHIFLLSTTSVILLLYVSPITITCAMFERTKGIFSGWWKQLLGLSLQPMILFAYLGVFIALFDQVIVGDVRFSGDGKKSPKKIICNNDSNLDVLIVDPISKGKINDSGNNTSIYCIFRVASIDTFHGLETLGIGLPVLASMTKEKLATITKAALLMFIFLKFLDQISKFAQELVGGATLSSDVAGAGKMAARMLKTMQDIQKRGMGALKKHGIGAAKEAGGRIKSAVRSLGSKGKKDASGGGDTNRGSDTSASSKAGDLTGSSKQGDVTNSSKKGDISSDSKS